MSELEHWWIDYWWMPVAALSVVVLLIVARVMARRGTLARTWPKITLAFTCVVILLMPSVPSPESYFLAVIAVCNLLILFVRLLTTENPPPAEGSARPSNPDGATTE